jgi:hypothetical protein
MGAAPERTTMTKPEMIEVHPTQELLTPDRLTVKVDTPL